MVWWWVVQLVVAVALSVASILMMPKPKTAKPAAATQADAPTSEAGRPWPVAFGTILISETNVLRVLENGVYEYDRKISKKEKQHIVEYTASIHLGGCLEADALVGITIDDKEAWSGNLDTMQSVYLDLPEFFGGDDKEGGIRGEFFNLIGRPDQMMPGTLCERWGETSDDTPAYRKRSSVFFAGLSAGQGFLWRKNSPVLAQKVGLRYRRSSKGPMADATRMIGIDSNPAHMIFECMTNTEWGMGDPVSAFNLTTWNAVAQQLYDEGFGLSMVWVRQSTVEEFVNELQDHIQANIFLDPTSGLWEIDLMRGDYDVETLDHLTVDNADLTGFNRALWGEQVNEVVVTYTNPITEKPESTTGHMLGSILNQGLVSTSRDYHGIRDADLAKRVADRDVRSSSASLATLQAGLDRRSWTVRPGKLFIVTWPAKNIFGMVCRAMDVDYGDHLDSKIRVKLMQDVFSLEKPTPSGSQPPVDPDPTSDPQPMAATEVFTLPAYFVSSSDLQPQPLDLAYPQTVAGVLAFQGDSAVYPYQLLAANVESTGDLAYVNEGAKTTVERMVLPVGLAAAITSLFPDAWVARKERGPQVGGYVFFGAGDDSTMEIAQVIAYDDELDSWVLARGVMDTVPRPWAVATPVWFVNPGVRILDDLVLRQAGDTVIFRLLSRTARGVLPIAAAPIVSETLSARPWLPLRPAQVVVNGSYFGPVPVGAGPNIRVTWSTRNRVFEDGLILRWDETSVAPEYTQGTVISVYDQGGVLRYRREGLWTETLLDLPAAWFARYTSITIKVTSKRHDLGLESLQGQGIVVTGLPGNAGAAAPPAPPALTTPPATEPAPGAGAWVLQGYAFSVTAGSNVPALLVTGKRDRPDAIGLNVRYRKVGSTDWLNDRETTLSDAAVAVPNTTVASNTTYEVEVSYRLSTNLPTLWRSLGSVTTGLLKADDSVSVGGRNGGTLLGQVDQANAAAAAAQTTATAAKTTADAASTALFDSSNGALTRLSRLASKGSNGALNPNGDYRDWAGSLLLPYRYSVWVGGTSPFGRTTGLYGDSVDVTAPAGIDVGYLIGDANMPLPTASSSKLTFEGDIELVSGSFDGAGILLVADSGPPSYGSGASVFLSFKSLFGSGIAGRVYRLLSAVQSLPFISGQARYYMIMMNHWSGAPAGSGAITAANRIRWHRCEVFQASDIQASYTSDIAVLTAADVAAAGRLTVAEGLLRSVPNLLKNSDGSDPTPFRNFPSSSGFNIAYDGAIGSFFVAQANSSGATRYLASDDYPTSPGVAFSISLNGNPGANTGATRGYFYLDWRRDGVTIGASTAFIMAAGAVDWAATRAKLENLVVPATVGGQVPNGWRFVYAAPNDHAQSSFSRIMVNYGDKAAAFNNLATERDTLARVRTNEIAQSNTDSSIAALNQSVGTSLRQGDTLNANSRFGAYTTSPGLPDGWSIWSGAASRFSRQTGQGAYYAVRGAPAAGENLGFSQTVSITAGKYLVTFEGFCSAGNWAGAGLWMDSYGPAINCATDVDASGAVGVGGTGVRRWSKIITLGALGAANVYAMYGWSGLGSVTAKTLDVYVCAIEPLDASGQVALSAQADASTALTSYSTLSSAFAAYQTTVASTYATQSALSSGLATTLSTANSNANSAISTYNTGVQAQFSAIPGQISTAKSEAISTANAYADGAISTYNLSVSTGAGGLAATAAQAYLIASNVNGVVSAGIGLRVSAGLITGYAGLTAGGGGSAFDIDATYFRVWNGSNAEPVFVIAGGVTYINDLKVRNESIIPGAVNVPVTAKNLSAQQFGNAGVMVVASVDDAKVGQSLQFEFTCTLAYPSSRITIDIYLYGSGPGSSPTTINTWQQSFDGQDKTQMSVTWAEPVTVAGTQTYQMKVNGSRLIGGLIDCTFSQMILKMNLQKV